MTTPKQERDHWSTRATDAEVWAVSPSDWIPSTEAVVDRIVGHLDGCTRIMEIGCGTGRLTSRIAAALPEATVTGVVSAGVPVLTNDFQSPLQVLHSKQLFCQNSIQKSCVSR